EFSRRSRYTSPYRGACGTTVTSARLVCPAPNRYEITECFELLQQVAVSKKSWCELVLVREREQSVVSGTNGIDREISVRIRHAGLQQKRIAAQSEFRQQGESRALQGAILDILDDARHRSYGIADRNV